MKKYDYNTEFFGQWLREHSDISKRDILTVIENKDYASLKRWAEGNIMPTHTILRLCNHYGIDIWNFFLGMTPRTSASDVETSETVTPRTMSDTENEVKPLEQAEEAGANITPADLNVKKAQWEARYQKDLHMKEIEHQRQMDEMRKEYEQRIDEQRREYMAQMDNLIKQNMVLTQIATRDVISGFNGIASEHRGASVPNPHPTTPSASLHKDIK